MIWLIIKLLISACEFNCEADGYCIEEYLVCDGYKHCSDGQDEYNCGRLNFKNKMNICNIWLLDIVTVE